MNALHRSWLAGFSLLLFGTSGVFAGDAPKTESPKTIFAAKGELTDQDAPDKLLKKSFHKVHEVPFKEGETYRIDVASDDFDAFLRVEDPNGKMIGYDDDSGGGNNARLAIRSKVSGPHRLIITSYRPSETGKYSLTVSEPTKLDLLTSRVKGLASLTTEERTKTLGELVEHFEKLGAKISPEDGRLAFQAGFAMEGVKTPGVGDWYTKLGRALNESDNPQVKKLAKTMEGSARRVRLPGNTIAVKGPLLDGKEIDWNSYRGKVVLVDFWATWCGPCIAELPNVKRMYDAYKDKGFDVVGISLDRDAEKPAAFMKKRQLPWACIYDENQPLSEHYGVMGIPLAILVDKEGKVVSLNARGPELVRLLAEQLGPIPEPKVEEKSQP